MTKHNNPGYYTWHPAAPECYRVAQEFTYNCGNALTYIWRAGRKPGNDAVRDLEKAIDHLRFEVERLKGLDADRNKPFSAACDQQPPTECEKGEQYPGQRRGWHCASIHRDPPECES